MDYLHDALAGLLTYPDADYRLRLDECRHDLSDCVPEAASLLGQFIEQIAGLSVEELEELYTHTFDLNPVASLEVGWHLFGENYSRGEFLVLMRQQMRRLGVEETTELPDHLTLVLRTLARMPTREADRFTSRYVLPALEKMLAGLGGKNSPYRFVLEAIRSVLTSPAAVSLEEAAS